MSLLSKEKPERKKLQNRTTKKTKKIKKISEENHPLIDTNPT